jgi:hypothetical protein
VSKQIDRTIKGLPWANIAFNTPTTLSLGDTVVLQLLLSRHQPIRQLKAQLTEVGKKEGAKVQVSDEMEARLTGLGFRIAAITPERQRVTPNTTTEWEWEIEATETGTHRLHLTLSALIDVNGSSTPHTVQVFDRSLVVEVTWFHNAKQFVAHN